MPVKKSSAYQVILYVSLSGVALSFFNSDSYVYVKVISILLVAIIYGVQGAKDVSRKKSQIITLICSLGILMLLIQGAL
jgi:hypothetical protein